MVDACHTFDGFNCHLSLTFMLKFTFISDLKSYDFCRLDTTWIYATFFFRKKFVTYYKSCPTYVLH